MLHETAINLGNLLLSFSEATDLANPPAISHQLRTAYIALQIAKEAKLSKNIVEKLYIAALFHDVGALTSEEKRSIHAFEEKNDTPHCVLGEMLINQSIFLSRASAIIRCHHTPWHKWGNNIFSPNVFESQILYLSDFLERSIDRDQYILHQNEELIGKISFLEGKEIHVDIVDLFVSVAKREDFWLNLVSPRLYSTLLHTGPFKRVEIDYEDLCEMTDFFRSVIDFKSSYTATHSTGVGECAFMLSKLFGLTTNEISMIQLAGFLHDIGKLSLPNEILEKPGRFTKEEFALMKKHTYHSYAILNSIDGLGNIPEWAAFHHERLNGTGYPFHVNDQKIGTGARIMAVADMFTAMAEHRPHRNGMERSEIEKVLMDTAEQQWIDKNIVSILFDNYDEVSGYVAEKQFAAKTDYDDFVIAHKHLSL